MNPLYHSNLFVIGTGIPHFPPSVMSVNEVVRPPALEAMLEGANSRSLPLEDFVAMDVNQVGISNVRVLD